MEEEKEIELIDYINVFVKRKWVILFGTVICAVGAMVFNAISGPVPPTYEARASVLVIPPVFRTELTPPQFSTGIYEALAKAQDLEQSIIDTLRLVGAAGDPLEVSALDPMLETETVTQSPPDRSQPEKVAPGASLLELIVTSANVETVPLVDMANTWARLFVQKNSGFTSEEAVGSYDFIKEQYETARSNLHAAEDALNAFNRRNEISVLKGELAARSPKLSEYQGSYVNTVLDLAYKEQTLSDLQKQLEAMETADGIWVGSFDTVGAGGIRRALLNEDQRQVLDAVLQTRDGILTLQEAIRVFQDETDLEFLSQDLGEKRGTFVAYINRLSQMKIDASSMDQILQETRAPVDLKGIPLPPGSPIPTDLLREIMSLQTGYNFYRPRLDHLQTEMVRLRGQIDSLENVQYERQQELARMTEKLALLKDIYQTLVADYTQNKKQANSVKLAINAVRPKVDYYQERLDALRGETKALTVEIADLELEGSRLARDITTYKSTFDKFAKLVEDARINKANQPGDVKIAARAVGAVVIPPEAGRSVVMLAAAIGLMVSIFLAFFLEYVEKARERQAAEQAQRSLA